MATTMATALHRPTAEPAATGAARDHQLEDAARIVAGLERTDVPAARESLRATAERAGVGVGVIARGVVLFHGR